MIIMKGHNYNVDRKLSCLFSINIQLTDNKALIIKENNGGNLFVPLPMAQIEHKIVNNNFYQITRNKTLSISK